MEKMKSDITGLAFIDQDQPENPGPFLLKLFNGMSTTTAGNNRPKTTQIRKTSKERCQEVAREALALIEKGKQK